MTIQIARSDAATILVIMNSKGSVISTIPDWIAHTTAFVIQVMEHWLEREIGHWVHHSELI